MSPAVKTSAPYWEYWSPIKPEVDAGRKPLLVVLVPVDGAPMVVPSVAQPL